MRSEKFRQLAAILADVFPLNAPINVCAPSAAGGQTHEVSGKAGEADFARRGGKQNSREQGKTLPYNAEGMKTDEVSGQIATIFADFCAYEAILRKWQPHINLIAPSTLADIWRRHILDSAQLFVLQPEAKIWLDLGSGGGFPALVIACLLKQRNQRQSAAAEKAHIFLVESNGKKAGFLRKAIQELNLPASVVQKRIEAGLADLPVPQVITARALSSLAVLCGFIAPLMARAGDNKILALLQKGGAAEEEIKQAEKDWAFDLERRPSRIAADSVILLLRNIRKIAPAAK